MEDNLNNQHHHKHSQCGCCGSRLCSSEVSRRGFLVGMGAAAGGLTVSALAATAGTPRDPVRFDTTRTGIPFVLIRPGNLSECSRFSYIQLRKDEKVLVGEVGADFRTP